MNGKVARGPLRRKLEGYLASLGPGLITGASDDDPSGIGTYAQTGAQFGYAQLWTALATWPLQAAVQEMCARIGLETGAGLAEVIRRHYSKRLLFTCASLLVISNIVNIGADLGAMAASAQIIVPLPLWIWLLGITLLSVGLEIIVEYKRYSRFLRLLTISLASYALVVLWTPQDWGRALLSTLIPRIVLSKDYLLNLVAVLGTTISPYLFFWQASEEVEEEICRGKVTLQSRRGVTRGELKMMRTDVASGVLFSNAAMWFIMATAASTLFRNGVHQIESPSQAAEMLKPIAGDFASFLFAAGIVGTGLLAVPVLAGSAAYVVAETLKFQKGLYLRFNQATRFYSVIAIATLIGAALNVTGINPIQALYYTAVLNGIVAPPLLFMIMRIANDPEIMGSKTNGPLANTLGWTTTIVMTIAALALGLSIGINIFVTYAG